MRLLPNVGTERVVDLLPSGQSLSVSTGATSVFGLSQLLHGREMQRLLLSPDATLQTDEADRRRRNGLTMRGEGLDGVQRLTRVETRVSDLPLRQSLLLCAGTSRALAFVGDCDLTTAGLGIAPSRAAGMIQLLEDPVEVGGVAQWFEELWRRSRQPETNPLLANLHEVSSP